MSATWFRFKYAQGHDAVQIARTIAASVPMAAVISEGERTMTARQIAVLACDIAQAVTNEMLEREWIEMCEPPEPKR